MKNKLMNTIFTVAMTVGAYAVLNILGADEAAAQNLGTAVTGLKNSISEGSALIYTGAYISGATALVMGAAKLKAHADNPSQTPLGHGLVRIAAGTGLIAMPGVADMTLNTLGINKNVNVTGSTANIDIN